MYPTYAQDEHAQKFDELESKQIKLEEYAKENPSIIVETLHEAVEEGMKAFKNVNPTARENQDRMDYTKDLKVRIDAIDVNEPTISKAMPGGLEDLVKYVLELRDGIRDFELDYKNQEEEKWGYTYHKEFQPYMDPCLQELKRNTATRRAVLPIAGPKSYGTIDPPCLQEVMFIIKNGKLDTSAIFRSNDAVGAFAMNSFGIIELARSFANELGIPLGSYTHFGNNFHVYSRDFDTLDSYCQMFEKRKSGECNYRYEEYLEAYEEYAPEYIEKCEERREMLKQSHMKRGLTLF